MFGLKNIFSRGLESPVDSGVSAGGSETEPAPDYSEIRDGQVWALENGDRLRVFVSADGNGIRTEAYKGSLHAGQTVCYEDLQSLRDELTGGRAQLEKPGHEPVSDQAAEVGMETETAERGQERSLADLDTELDGIRSEADTIVGEMNTAFDEWDFDVVDTNRYREQTEQQVWSLNLIMDQDDQADAEYLADKSDIGTVLGSKKKRLAEARGILGNLRQMVEEIRGRVQEAQEGEARGMLDKLETQISPPGGAAPDPETDPAPQVSGTETPKPEKSQESKKPMSVEKENESNKRAEKERLLTELREKVDAYKRELSSRINDASDTELGKIGEVEERKDEDRVYRVRVFIRRTDDRIAELVDRISDQSVSYQKKVLRLLEDTNEELRTVWKERGRFFKQTREREEQAAMGTFETFPEVMGKARRQLESANDIGALKKMRNNDKGAEYRFVPAAFVALAKTIRSRENRRVVKDLMGKTEEELEKLYTAKMKELEQKEGDKKRGDNASEEAGKDDSGKERPPRVDRTFEELEKELDPIEIDALVGIVAKGLLVALEYARASGMTKKDAVQLSGGVDEVVSNLAPAMATALSSEWSENEKSLFSVRITKKRVESFAEKE